MISVYKLKPAFQKLLEPILKKLYTWGMSANQITIVSVLLSVGLGVLFYYRESNPYFLLLIALGLLVRMGLNALDGMMARTYNMQSKLGEVLNELGDIVSDICILFPFMGIGYTNKYLFTLFLIMIVVNEFAGVMGKIISNERRYDGPMGKSDRALLIGVLCIVFYFYPQAYSAVNYVFSLALVLLIVSTVNRLKNALK